MEERLIANSRTVDGGYSSECWEWIGNRDAKSYGRITVRVNGKHKKRRAHRVSYETFKGPIPEGYDIDHKCTNPWCISPDHLEAEPVPINRGKYVQQRRPKAQVQRPAAANEEGVREDDRRAA